jgi:hypothetical protein
MQRVFSALILAATLFGCLIGLRCIHVAQHVYPYAIPFVIATIVCCLVGTIAVITNTVAVCLTQNTMVVVSFGLFMLTVRNWPGGDDGPGMALMWLGGMTFLPATGLSLIASITTLITVAVKELASKRSIDAKWTSGDEVG